MSCSPAQLEANRRNAAKSTGPRTDQGKVRSRRNGLKHGLTGAGIVLPDEDAEAVQRRMDELEDEMRPQSTLACTLVGRVALMTVRLDRSAEQEAKALSHRVRRAAEDFDDERLAAAEHALSWIAHEPATHARRLRKSIEGLELLIREMQALRDDLGHPNGHRWDWHHCERFQHLMGRRTEDLPVPRAKALTEAILSGNFRYLEPEDKADLEKVDRQLWAGGTLLDLIDDEIAALKKRLETFDREGLELDRAEAASRAKFDPSKEAILARKYEAASERALYRALKEFREVQPPTTELETKQPLEARSPGKLGSSLPNEFGGPPIEPEGVPEAEVPAVEGVCVRSEDIPTDVQPARSDPGRRNRRARGRRTAGKWAPVSGVELDLGGLRAS